MVTSGGFSDRIGGMATLHKIAKCLSVDFKIHFENPFNFFDVFPDKKEENKFDNNLLKTHNHIVKRYNLIDSNFEANIKYLCSDLTSKSEIIALVSINNVKPIVWNLLLDDFSHVRYQQADQDVIERFVLMNFGLEYLKISYEKFNNKFKEILPEFNDRVIGVQIRVGGSNLNWEDPLFKIPSYEEIAQILESQVNKFDKVFLCSDDLELKKNLLSMLNKKYKAFSFENVPLHVDRSKILSSDFITNSIGDHCLLRQCSAGVVIGGGGYGRSAAILSGVNYFRAII